MLANSLSSVRWFCNSPILLSKRNLHVIPSTSITFLSPGRFARVLSLSSSPPALLAKLEEFGENSIAMAKMNVLKQKLELLEINSGDSYVSGRYYNVLCPKCKGGKSMEKSLSLHIVQNGTFAMCRCFRFDCGWADRVFVDNQTARDGVESTMTEEIPGLVPLGDKLIAYFRERMISEETLQRNGVLQLSGDKDTAYLYLWNCKQYFDKVSRIILATDGDEPGQALAEGLARRLGKERCWQVRWPMKDEGSYFKDANEVLRYIGPSALKRIVENAEQYTSQTK